MSKKLRDFTCTRCGIVERLVRDHQQSIVCSCGNTAKRIVSAPRCFQNTTGKSPSC